jgi:hypothetical protein
MRTVLAVDEMLAHAVKRELPGEVEVVGHMRMRALGGLLASTLRGLVMQEPSVLVIGAKLWDPYEDLQEMALPASAAVVALVPTRTDQRDQCAAASGVFLQVAADDPKITETISAACLFSWAWLHGRRPRPLSPVLVAPPRRSRGAVHESSVVRVDLPHWKQHQAG